MSNWSPNLILVDADYLDEITGGVSAHFGPKIGRELPAADLCQWLDCVALDSGLREGKQEVQVVFLHSKEKEKFDNYLPAHFENELNGKAFEDFVGEFILQSFPVERVVSQAEFFVESLEAALASTDVKKVMVVGDMGNYGEKLTKKLAEDHGKHVILFSLQPEEGKGYIPENIGFSLLAALGIRGDELQ